MLVFHVTVPCLQLAAPAPPSRAVSSHHGQPLSLHNGSAKPTCLSETWWWWWFRHVLDVMSICQITGSRFPVGIALAALRTQVHQKIHHRLSPQCENHHRHEGVLQCNLTMSESIVPAAVPRSRHFPVVRTTFSAESHPVDNTAFGAAKQADLHTPPIFHLPEACATFRDAANLQVVPYLFRCRENGTSTRLPRARKPHDPDVQFLPVGCHREHLHKPLLPRRGLELAGNRTQDC